MNKTPKITLTHIILMFLKSINYIDLIGVVLFIVLLGSIFFFFSRRTEDIYVSLYVTENSSWDMGSKPPHWYLENIKPGLQLKDIFGKTTIKVEKVYKYVTSEPNGALYVVLKVKAVYSKATGQYSFEGIPMLVGNVQLFRLPGYLVRGIIRQVGKQMDSPIIREYKVNGYLDPKNNEVIIMGNVYNLNTATRDGIPLYISKLLIPGLKISDSDHNVVAKIDNVIKNPGTLQQISNGQILKIPDENREKVELRLSVNADVIDGEPFFRREVPLVINNVIHLNFENFWVNLTITSLELETK